MSARASVLVALLVQAVILLASWMLRIREFPAPLRIIGLEAPALAIWWAMYVRFFRYPRADRRPLPRDPVLAAIILAVLLVTVLGGFEEGRDLAGKLRFIVLVSIVVMGEELLFRGILQNALQRAMHPLAAIVLANVAFIASHAFVLDITPLSVSIIGAAGMLSGAVFQVTRSLWWPTWLHLAGDWVLTIPAPALLGNDWVLGLNAAIAVAVTAWWVGLNAKGPKPAA